MSAESLISLGETATRLTRVADFLFLLPALGLNAQRGNRPRQQPADADGVARFLAETEFAVADVAVTVVGADSPVAGQTLLQAYSSDSLGARQVRVLGKLEIPARGEVSLEPGVKELRLIGLKEDLRAGNELPLFFKTADGKVQALRVVIIKGYGQ